MCACMRVRGECVWGGGGTFLLIFLIVSNHISSTDLSFSIIL